MEEEDEGVTMEKKKRKEGRKERKERKEGKKKKEKRREGKERIGEEWMRKDDAHLCTQKK